MKELLTLLLILLIPVAGITGYNGVANAVKFHYMCGVDIPWYAALFLDVNKCPGFGGHKLDDTAQQQGQ
jgi:hypothetical protein